MSTAKKKSFWKRLKLKYRVTIYNYSTLEEVWSQNISRLNLFYLIGFLATFITVLVVLLMVFTPLREFIPGYTDEKMRREMVMNAFKVDSMSKVIEQHNAYLANLKIILNGGVPLPSGPDKNTKPNVDLKKIDFSKSEADSAFIEQMEQDDKYSFTAGTPVNSNDPSKMKFFPPLKGMITVRFNPSRGHYGTDLVATENQTICNVLNGTVVMAEWTIRMGYVIQIQHDNNLISVYKHNTKLLKEVGDYVKSGEPISLIGNSGEKSSGPHLHFELWHNGVPINPEKYIIF